MGARTVAQLAADYPHLPRRIVLEDPPWRDVEGPPGERTAHFQQLIAKYRSMTREQIVEYGRENNPTWDDEELWLWSKGKTLVSPYVVQGTSAPLITWREIVPKITCPALLVTGEPERGGICQPGNSS